MSSQTNANEFIIRDCALVVMATGTSALNLRELRDGIQSVGTDSIYQHFWGRLLQPQFDEPEYNNDFASWVYRALHEKALAERLSVMDPTEHDSVEDLREELLDIVELHLDVSESLSWAQADEQFFFLDSMAVILDTGLRASNPLELAQHLPALSNGSIFYHFVDARRRTESGDDDFSGWIRAFGDEYTELADRLSQLDPYFSSLKKIRNILAELCEECLAGSSQ